MTTPSADALRRAREVLLGMVEHSDGGKMTANCQTCEEAIARAIESAVEAQRQADAEAVRRLWRYSVNGSHDLSDANIARGYAFSAAVDAILARGK